MWLLVLVACVKQTTPSTPVQPAPEVVSGVILDGVAVNASWDDGDTFSIPDPNTDKRVRARLKGFNTLESYGPVHRWGEWTTTELYGLAKEAGVRADEGSWTCAVQEGGGGYGRILVDCPDLRLALVGEGLAHVFAIDDEPDAGALEAQQVAIAEGRGMWAKGAPEKLITSLHSLDERENQDQTYDRVVDLVTGAATKHEHSETYATCEEVCHHGSCMVYVPYNNRYRPESKAECLRVVTGRRSENQPESSSSSQ